jgi:FkbM family methyltransferase
MNGALVFDIGAFDGDDTAYYLEKGFRVVTVEANPDLVAQTRKRFAREVASGRVVLENVAIGLAFGTLVLHLCGDDLCASSIDERRIAHRHPAGTVEVRSIPLRDLLERHGVPFYLKSDIEGLDRYCILPLNRHARPTYVSFEMGRDAVELMDHLAGIGYTSFKIINQPTLREIENVECVADRVARRLRHTIGLPEARFVRRDGHRFHRGHGSGPMGEKTDGRWRSHQETKDRWQEYVRLDPAWQEGWYDLHARLF